MPKELKNIVNYKGINEFKIGYNKLLDKTFANGKFTNSFVKQVTRDNSGISMATLNGKIKFVDE